MSTPAPLPESALPGLQAVDTPPSEERPGSLPAPKLTPPSNLTVTLPGGFVDPNGRRHREAEVRELTGADEEALAPFDTPEQLPIFMHQLLTRAVMRIGDLVSLDAVVFNDLVLGDRDMLLLGIRRATYGDDLEMNIVCPGCRQATDVVIELQTDIPVHVNTASSIDVTMRRGGVVTLRFPTVGDQTTVIAAKKETSAAENTLMLSRLITKIDGQEPDPGFALRANVADRRKLLDAVWAAMPGPRYGEVKVPCPKCTAEHKLLLGLADLLPV